jgi:Ser/Thr protein kinase RdoA (MazF antagonist)
VEGQFRGTLSLEQGELLGKTPTQINTITDQYPQSLARPRFDFAYFVDDPLATLEAFSPLTHRSDAIVYFREVAAILRHEIANLPKTAPQYGLCHGDILTGNIMWKDDDKATIFDFDFSGYGWRVYDIATFLWGCLLDLPHIYGKNREVLVAFVDGYQSLRPLSNAEIRAIRYFIVARHFWLIRTEIRHTPGIGIGWLVGDFIDRAIAFIKDR